MFVLACLSLSLRLCNDVRARLRMSSISILTSDVPSLFFFFVGHAAEMELIQFSAKEK